MIKEFDNLTIRLPSELKEKIRRVAFQEGRSMNDLLLEILEAVFKDRISMFTKSS